MGDYAATATGLGKALHLIMNQRVMSDNLSIWDLLHPLWVFLSRQESRFLQIRLRQLARRNENDTKPIVAPQGPVVSVTTHGQRIDSVHLSLESIADGNILPSRIILWLDNEVAFNNRSRSLRRLEERGLEIYLTNNYGPHTKYYPYLESTEDFEAPLVIADDDYLYPRSWLSGLARSFNDNSDAVSCYRAHVVNLIDGNIAPYSSWTPCKSSLPSFRHFATACSGCIYPPRLLSTVKDAGTSFLDVSPKADDVWLHAQAIRAGIKIRQIEKWPLIFPVVPGTQQSGLFLSNVGLLQNDVQINATYRSSDVTTMASEQVLAITPSKSLSMGSRSKPRIPA